MMLVMYLYVLSGVCSHTAFTLSNTGRLSRDNMLSSETRNDIRGLTIW